ncbi:MAG: PEP-CTERM sorting domain-containing protein [Acidobacteriota bacterium]
MIRGRIGALLGGIVLLAGAATATTVDFQGIGSSTLTSYTTSEGVIFSLVPGHTINSGTGVFPSFLRMQTTQGANAEHPGIEDGFNSNGVALNDEDAGNGHQHTHDVLLSQLGIYTIDGASYYEFILDWNEPNSGSQRDLIIQQLLFVAGPGGQSLADPEAAFASGGLKGERFYNFSLDMATGEPGGPFEGFRVYDANQGSGFADFRIQIPTSLLSSLNLAQDSTNLILYARMGNAEAKDAVGVAEGTFEEFSFRAQNACVGEQCEQPPPLGDVPEPGTLLLLGVGLSTMGMMRKLRTKKKPASE